MVVFSLFPDLLLQLSAFVLLLFDLTLGIRQSFLDHFILDLVLLQGLQLAHVFQLHFPSLFLGLSELLRNLSRLEFLLLEHGFEISDFLL